eukprot:2904743-Rhodomonas_salina.2
MTSRTTEATIGTPSCRSTMPRVSTTHHHGSTRRMRLCTRQSSAFADTAKSNTQDAINSVRCAPKWWLFGSDFGEETKPHRQRDRERETETERQRQRHAERERERERERELTDLGAAEADALPRRLRHRVHVSPPSINGGTVPINGSTTPINGSIAPINGSTATINASNVRISSTARQVAGQLEHQGQRARDPDPGTAPPAVSAPHNARASRK